MLKRRISTPRAATVVALAAFVAFAATVAPSLAGSSFLTNQKAAKVYVSNKKAGTLYLKKKTASNLYVAKATASPPPVAAVAAGTAPFAASATTAGYIPTAFVSFATKTLASKAIITFSGNATCTSEKASSADACPIELLIDGQKTGKVNFSPATLASQKPVPVVQTVMLTSVLGKGGHTVSVQYAGAKNVTFNLSGWNLAVQAYPEVEETDTTTGGGSSK